MCGISGFEFVVILVIALLVLGPEKIPEILRFFGGVMRQVKELSVEVTKLKSDMLSSPQVEELKKQIRAEILSESGGKGAPSSKAERANDIATIDAIKRARAEAESTALPPANSVATPAHPPEHPPAHPPEPLHPPEHPPLAVAQPDPLAPRPAPAGTAAYDPNAGSDRGGVA